MYQGSIGGVYMKKIRIKVGSVTYAMKAKAVLQRYGLRVQIIKTAKPMKNEGCGYSLVVPATDLNVAEILRREGVSTLEMKWET